jgi:hypothetical protein
MTMPILAPLIPLLFLSGFSSSLSLRELKKLSLSLLFWRATL